MARQNMNAIFYATTYHPIQAGSIDGTDTASHDNAVYRALLASSTGLYDPAGDPKAEGDPYNTLFVGRLAHHTTETTLHQVMSKYGRIKRLRLVRHIVTGASRGYAFVEFETQHDMEKAYEVAQNHIIDGSPIMVDYNRQQLMPGWIPRRLGGGLGGRKESGQLRFGGRDRPFRAPLRPIPDEKLTKLGIALPPVGQYMSRFQLPPIPQRPGGSSKERAHYKQWSSRPETTPPTSKATLLLPSESRGRRGTDNQRNEQWMELQPADRGFSPRASTRGGHRRQQQQQQEEEDIVAQEGAVSDKERARRDEHLREKHHRHKKHRNRHRLRHRHRSSEHEEDERFGDRQREVSTSGREKRESGRHRRHERSTSSRSGHEDRDHHQGGRYGSPIRSSVGHREREREPISRHHRHKRGRRAEPIRSTTDECGESRSPKHDDDDDDDEEEETGKRPHSKRKRRDA